MKNLIFVLLSSLMLFSSCQKDEDFTITETQIPDSEEITSVKVNGLVSDEHENVLAEAYVQLFNNAGQLIGQTVTDQEGKFNFEDIDAPNSKLLIYAEKSDYNSGVKKLDPAPQNTENIHLKLASTDLYPQIAAVNPSSSDLISLDGQVVDTTGTPVEAFVLAFIDGELFNIALTDPNGYYQLIVASEEIINIEVYQICGSSIASFDVGPFNDDQLLDDIITAELSSYSITGTLIDCNGNPVTNGYALINWSPSITSSVPVNDAGEFGLEISDCYAINNQIIITGFDLTADNTSNQVSIGFNNTDVAAGSINECNQDESFVTFELDGSEYTFQPLIANVVKDSITDPISGQTTLKDVTNMIYQSTNGLNSLIITITGASNGTYFVSDLLMVINGQPIAPISSDPIAFDVDGTFTNHTNTPRATIEGNFEGTFIYYTGQRTVNGFFKAIQQ